MNNYELVVVLDGKATAAKKKAVSELIGKMVTVLSGKVVKTTDWGVKDLAYTIKKSTTGLFIIFDLELSGEGAKELGKKINLEEDIIRHLFIKAENTK